MAETLKEGLIRAAIEQAERLGGVKEPLARMLVSKIQRILTDEGDDAPLAADLWTQPEITPEIVAEAHRIAGVRPGE